jgi:hypothetical protein
MSWFNVRLLILAALLLGAAGCSSRVLVKDCKTIGGGFQDCELVSKL